MENFEYSKVFPSENEGANDLDPNETDIIKDFLHSYERELRDNPRFLLPYAPAIFEKTVAACERIAKEFSGRLKAKIDYSFFSATIEIWCCYVEFQRGEFMSILQEISNHAISVRFTPLTSGDLHIEIVMPYFASIQQEKDTY